MASELIRDASDSQKLALYQWAIDLLAIRDSNLPTVQKAKMALSKTSSKEILFPLLKRAYRKLKKVLWTDRGWWFRIGGGGILLAVAAVSGKSLGLATMGFGVGIPLWIVFGGGGAFAGLIIDKLKSEYGVPRKSCTTNKAHEESPLQGS